MKKASSGFVLKFISGKYQGGEFPLEKDSEIIIGRSSDLSMVLVEDMVSRHHSKITTHNNDLFIEDLGSTNGTFVNGEKISKKRLKEGDRILVGTSIIKLITTGSEEASSQDIRDMPSQDHSTKENLPAITPTRRGQAEKTTTTGAISGLIEEVPISDLLQLFSTSKKNGTFTIDKHGVLAEIFLREGRVYFARLSNAPEISPYKAFYRMLSWTTGNFALENATPEAFEEEIDASTEALLMEGVRQLDEIANLGPVPKMEERLKISQPLLPPLRSLTPELLDTMQLIHNCSEVEEILNTSLASDLETLQDIVYLLQNEYVLVTQ